MLTTRSFILFSLVFATTAFGIFAQSAERPEAQRILFKITDDLITIEKGFSLKVSIKQETLSFANHMMTPSDVTFNSFDSMITFSKVAPFVKPELQWLDSQQNVIDSEELQESDDRYFYFSEIKNDKATSICLFENQNDEFIRYCKSLAPVDKSTTTLSASLIADSKTTEFNSDFNQSLIFNDSFEASVLFTNGDRFAAKVAAPKSTVIRR